MTPQQIKEITTRVEAADQSTVKEVISDEDANLGDKEYDFILHASQDIWDLLETQKELEEELEAKKEEFIESVGAWQEMYFTAAEERSNLHQKVQLLEKENQMLRESTEIRAIFEEEREVIERMIRNHVLEKFRSPK